MKKLFSLFAAVLFAAGMMAEVKSDTIKWTAPVEQADLATSYLSATNSEFYFNQVGGNSIEANNCKFGTADVYNQYTHRFKSGGATGSSRILWLNIPKAGVLKVAARTAKDSDTRILTLKQGEATLVSAKLPDDQTLVPATDGKGTVYSYVVVDVEAGVVNIELSAAINIYGFILETEDTPAGPVEGVLDFSAADSASLVWNLPLKDAILKKDTVDYTDGVNTLTVGAATDGTYYFNYTFGEPNYWALLFGKKGAYVETKVSYDVAKIEVTGCEGGGSGNTVFDVYAGDTKIGTHTSSKDAWEVTVPATHKAAGTVYRIQVASSHNAQIAKIVLVEAVAGAPEAPVFSVEGGVYASAQTVELSCVTEGADIHYTLDGTEPTAASALYTAALSISETTTVKALAVKNGLTSAVVSATYTILTLDGDGTKENPYSLADVVALNNSVKDAAWVKGTIAGCYKDNKFVAGAEGALATNIGLEAGEVHVPVQLPTGDIRTALNLLDNPGNLDKEVMVYGTLEAYFSVPGVKNVEDYEWVLPSSVDNTIEAAKATKMMVNGQLVIVRDGKTYNAVGAQL